MKNILEKIEKAGLVGRGGAEYPTALKWKMVKEAVGEKKYVVANGSEGEPGVKKDGYILQNFPDRVVNGMKIAINFLHAEKGILYLNEDLYKKHNHILEKIIGSYPIEVFKKSHEAGYIGGDETAVLNVIEGGLPNPRMKPPYPTTNGLWDCPTLINNIETFYDVSLAAADNYENKRFFTLNGDIINHGVFAFDKDYTIEKVLKETNNFSDHDFFVQIGGDAAGEVLNKGQLRKKVTGAGSITVFSYLKHPPMDMIRQWVNFFKNESCGQCTPCREGTYRLWELINSKEINWQMFSDILNVLDESSFCALGLSASLPIKTFVKNVLPNYQGDYKNIKIK